ncbi:DUF6458 family protein [Actinomadura atramentaria]|uniref:DUF6458 family protein n=1 Tax=Actinomadura atramentaria TaxID=1990 RepID=UPI00035CC8B6|nr:DUF6458 family protein [Actinomadura atramentaria]
MTIGGSIALIIIGAILAYAVDYQFSGIDIRLVGVILMIGGLIGLVVGIVRIATARRRVVERPAEVRERRYYQDVPSGRREYRDDL